MHLAAEEKRKPSGVHAIVCSLVTPTWHLNSLNRINGQEHVDTFWRLVSQLSGDPLEVAAILANLQTKTKNFLSHLCYFFFPKLVWFKRK